jgi:ACR3 family arsenite transporter
MMYPILCKVRYEVLHRVFRERQLWTQVVFSIVVNWILAPLVMVYFSSQSDQLSPQAHMANSSSQLALAWAFLPDKSALREGLILVGVARCIAMVSLIAVPSGLRN